MDKPNVHLDVKENTLVINHIQLTSDVDRNKESQVQATLIPEDCTEAYLFGTGLGDCQTTLLSRNHLVALHVVILNIEVFWLSLNVNEQSTWLADDRVSLHTAETMLDVAFPFIALPAEMQLCDNRSAQLCDRLAIELNHEFVSSRFQSEADFKQRMVENMRFVTQDSSIKSLPLPQVNEIFVCGAGPTLNNHIDWLKTQNPYIVAVDASINTLLTNGITPDIVVSIDHTSAKLFDDRMYDQLKDASLVYFPNSDFLLLERWQGQRFVSYSETPMYADVREEVKLEPLFSAGSVIHPAVDLANKLGAKTIYLLGTDFAYVYGSSHAKGNENAYQQSPDLATQWVINSHGKRVPTMANLKAYLRDLERYIEKYPQVAFINGSAEGAKIEGTTLWST
ncbi:MAG: 6-hydroxymethylpterin diphosphokinase MptE-like protein [Pseudomonadota bacterium]